MAVVGGMVFANSGYNHITGIYPGNVLLAFAAERLHYRATIEDPTVFTRPWTIGLTLKRGDGEEIEEIMEEACFEGDKFGKESFAALPD